MGHMIAIVKTYIWYASMPEAEVDIPAFTRPVALAHFLGRHYPSLHADVHGLSPPSSVAYVSQRGAKEKLAMVPAS